MLFGGSMTITVVKQAELDRIKTALFHAGEIVALESLASSVGMPLHILQIIHRLPSIINRIRHLVLSIETAAQGFFEAEAKALRHIEDSRTGVMEIAATVAAPVARLALGNGTAWVKVSQTELGQAAPANTTDLVGRLSGVSEIKTPSLRVETFPLEPENPAGARRFVVYVPGTKAFLGGPLDMRTNVLELAGQRSPVEAAVELALSQAGAGAGDKVFVVGHSLGGMVAVSLADRSQHGLVPYEVDKVLQIGAPVGLHSPIKGLEMLSVDGKGDIVPLLDGFGAPKWQGSTLLEVNQGINPIENHEIQTYLSELTKNQPSADVQRFGQFPKEVGSVQTFEFGVNGVPW